MPLCSQRGSSSAPIWFVFEQPYSSDVPGGYLLSGGFGKILFRMLQEAKIDINNCYFISHFPNTTDKSFELKIIELANREKPPLVCVVGDAAGVYLPELREKDTNETSKGQLQKYAGSLLKCKSLTYPHYMVPLYGPDRCAADWAERNITTYVDLQKIRDEFEHWRTHSTLRPLPARVLKYNDMEMDELLVYLDRFRSAKILSDDIENPVYNSKQYAPHPGYPFLIGLSDSSDFGISFKLFRDKPSENRILWRKLDDLFYNAPILLGQNIFNYDALFHEACGFRIRLDRVQDTLIRHHILWPELSHKLQFMTRQYTREPYYKDDGHSWTYKYLNRYRRYNALDACVTREIYDAQEEEFKQRPLLR